MGRPPSDKHTNDHFSKLSAGEPAVCFVCLCIGDDRSPDFTKLQVQLPTEMDEELYTTIKQFLLEINIEVREEPIDSDTFLPGLDILRGAIRVDREKLLYVGDLLHEAGHVAVTEPELRPLTGTPDMDPEWPGQGQEITAMLWSYAAACHLKIAPEVVFHPDGYKGDAQWMTDQIKTAPETVGLPLFIWMGFCDRTEDFPRLKKWLR